MLMYTSCGWFFDELSGIETVQTIQYAGRALQLAQELAGDRHIETHFVELLAKAKSNVPEHKDGLCIYEKFVKPAVVDLQRVAAHYAVSSLFEEYAEQTKIYCFTINQKQYQFAASGNTKLALGNASVTSEITEEAEQVDFGTIHFGDHNLNCGVRTHISGHAFQNVAKQVSGAFARADFLNAVRLLDKYFGASAYSLKSLFRDQQRQILNLILESTLGEAEAMYRHLYNRYAPMMRFLKDTGTPLPGALSSAAEIVLNADICRALERMQFDRGELHLLDSAGAASGVHRAVYDGGDRRKGMQNHGANTTWVTREDNGSGHLRVWARGHHRRHEDVQNNGMLRVEIPLGVGNPAASKLVLIKDLTQEPVHPNTLRRIEYLRRSVTGAMKRLYPSK